MSEVWSVFPWRRLRNNKNPILRIWGKRHWHDCGKHISRESARALQPQADPEDGWTRVGIVRFPSAGTRFSETEAAAGTGTAEILRDKHCHCSLGRVESTECRFPYVEMKTTVGKSLKVNQMFALLPENQQFLRERTRDNTPLRPPLGRARP